MRPIYLRLQEQGLGVLFPDTPIQFSLPPSRPNRKQEITLKGLTRARSKTCSRPIWDNTLSHALAKYQNLSAVLAFVSIVHIDKEIIQGIFHAVPGKRAALTQRFRRTVDEL
jgi:hypothetical protein